MTLDLGTSLSQRPLLALVTIYAGGVLTSLTPCLYPMIPVTVSVVGGGAVQPSRSRRMLLGLTYVIGLSITYATLGLVAGLTGTMFGTISTNPWLYFVMANAMLIAALMMLDALPVPLPTALLTWAANLGVGGRFAGVLVMGIVSGLVAAPCGAPMFGAVLTWVSTTGSGLLGLAYLIAFSFGMCTLLLVVAFAADAAIRLPRPGPWMLWVKRVLGVVLLGVAEYYLISMGQLII